VRRLLLRWRRRRRRRLCRAAKKIAVVPGDGIGPEVMDEAIKVLDAGEDCIPASRRAPLRRRLRDHSRIAPPAHRCR
jgi:hypothetical protein